MPDERKTRR